MECDYCSKTPETVHFCGNECYEAVYCGQECADAHYVTHALICRRPSTSFGPRGRAKVHKVMKEFKEGKLHSGSKKGPIVTRRKQAVAIALAEARRRK